MNFLIQVLMYISIIQCREVMCKPHHHFKNIEKRVHFEILPVPFKPITFVWEKIVPFGQYNLRHKRQIAESEITPISNEIAVTNVVIDDIPKAPEEEILVKTEKDLTPEVIITSIIKPIENGKSNSFVLPVEPEVMIASAEKGSDIIQESNTDVLIKPEEIPKPEESLAQPGPIIEIIPKPAEVPPLPEPKPVVEHVIISTPVESSVPPIIPALPQNLNVPVISPVINNVPPTPFLYTDISQIPLSGVPYPAPVPVPIPEVIVPPPPPPPPVKPPVVKEETPNFFVKGSRFVIYFGSMMLQMLSQLVNGRINLNQPLPEFIPG